MKVLVTGSEGQVARSLTERGASHQGIEIVTTSRAQVDLAQPGSLAAAIAAEQPQLVINAAAYTAVDAAEDEPALAFRVNAEAAGEAAQAAHAIGAPIIQLSTDYVFSGEDGKAYGEDDPTQPLSAYGRTKLAGEQAVRAANPAHLILRTAWVYSPFGRNFVKTMVAAARARPALDVVDDQFGSPTSALDLADAILVLAGRLRDGDRRMLGRTYHLAGSGQASWYELATTVMEACRHLALPAAEVRPIATCDWPTKARRPAFAVLDCSRIERDLALRLPQWRESVEQTVTRLALGPEGRE